MFIIPPTKVDRLTHWGWGQNANILLTEFSNSFSSLFFLMFPVKMFEFRLKFHWSLFLMVRLTINQHWFRKWLGTNRHQPLPGPVTTQINDIFFYLTQPQWTNTFRVWHNEYDFADGIFINDDVCNLVTLSLKCVPKDPSNDKSSLVEIMIPWWTGVSHYLNQFCAMTPNVITRKQWLNYSTGLYKWWMMYWRLSPFHCFYSDIFYAFWQILCSKHSQ